MPRILIVGATSAIAEAVARLYAERGAMLYLVARNAEHLARIAADLATRGAARIETAQLDVTAYERHTPVLDAAWQAMEAFDVVLLAHGAGLDERAAGKDSAMLRAGFDLNATAMLSLMNEATLRLGPQGHGTLAVLSSVAGERGRNANLVYGSAKAAITAYADGLRQRLYRKGVNVLTVKPGWVHTPMTAGMHKNALFVDTPRVAGDIVRAIDRGRHSLFTPWFWRPISAALRAIPGSLWQRLRF